MALHSHKSQKRRLAALHTFRAGKHRVIKFSGLTVRPRSPLPGRVEHLWPQPTFQAHVCGACPGTFNVSCLAE